MRNKGKVLVLMLSAAALVAASVFGTMAYLTDEEAVTNTFTVGQVNIKLDETDVKTDGTKDTDVRVDKNDYKLIPGRTYIKDPTVHVDAKSEDCWIFVEIENQISDIEGSPTVAEQMSVNWKKITGEDNVYAYNTTVSAGTDVVVFEKFTIDGNKANSTNLPDYEGKTIVVTAYAVQAYGFDTAQAAWDAAGFDT